MLDVENLVTAAKANNYVENQGSDAEVALAAAAEVSCMVNVHPRPRTLSCSSYQCLNAGKKDNKKWSPRVESSPLFSKFCRKRYSNSGQRTQHQMTSH